MAHIITDEHRAELYQRLLGDLPTDALERLDAGNLYISGKAEREAVERLVQAARAARHAILYHDSIGTRYEADAALAMALEPFATVLAETNA